MQLEDDKTFFSSTRFFSSEIPTEKDLRRIPALNICCPRDCVSRHTGGTSGAPLKPLRVDSALKALSTLRGSRGAPEAPPLCRQTSVSRTANVGTSLAVSWGIRLGASAARGKTLMAPGCGGYGSLGHGRNWCGASVGVLWGRWNVGK